MMLQITVVDLEVENAALKDRVKHLQGVLVTPNDKINELRDQNARQEKIMRELMAEVERVLGVRK